MSGYCNCRNLSLGCRGPIHRKTRISGATFDRWKATFGGMDLSDAKAVEAVADENSKPKILLIEPVVNIATKKTFDAQSLQRNRRLEESSAALHSDLHIF